MSVMVLCPHTVLVYTYTWTSNQEFLNFLDPGTYLTSTAQTLILFEKY